VRRGRPELAEKRAFRPVTRHGKVSYEVWRGSSQLAAFRREEMCDAYLAGFNDALERIEREKEQEHESG